MLGAINLWKFITTETVQDVTYTQLSDGGVNIDGTASVNSKKTVINSTDFPKGTFKCKGTNDVNLAIVVEGYNGSTWVKVIKEVWASDDVFDVDYNGYTNLVISLRVIATKTIDNKTIYPMLVTENTPLSPYVMPAMTNQQLTQEVTPITSAVTNCVGTSQPFNVLTKIGKVVYFDYKAEGVEATAYDTILFVLPSGFRPKNNQAYNFTALDLNSMQNVTINLNTGSAGNCQAFSNIVSGHKIEMHASWITD